MKEYRLAAEAQTESLRVRVLGQCILRLMDQRQNDKKARCRNNKKSSGTLESFEPKILRRSPRIAARRKE